MLLQIVFLGCHSIFWCEWNKKNDALSCSTTEIKWHQKKKPQTVQYAYSNDTKMILPPSW